jgi:hypothetical protein
MGKPPTRGRGLRTINGGFPSFNGVASGEMTDVVPSFQRARLPYPWASQSSRIILLVVNVIAELWGEIALICLIGIRPGHGYWEFYEQGHVPDMRKKKGSATACEVNTFVDAGECFILLS